VHSTVFCRPARVRGGPPCRFMSRVCQEFWQRDDVSPLAVEGLVLEVLTAAARGARRQPAHALVRWLQGVCELLRDRFADRLTLEEIASTVGVHPTHLGGRRV